MTTVLIGFADAVSAPEVAWSLVDSGFRIVTFAKKGTSPALCRSRLVEMVYVSDPAVSVARVLAELQAVVQRLGDPILMPLDDASLWVAQELLQRVHVQVAGATGRQAEVALDKRLQLETAAAAGFAVPETRLLQSAKDLGEFSTLPGIVKPALAARVVGGRLGRRRSYVVANAEELAALKAAWCGDEPMLAQPLLHGVGEGLFGLALDDQVVHWSGHRRVRMMNPSGSGSSACISLKLGPEICVVAERFLAAIGWRGMFMIELLRDTDGQLWFMELNGRPWGSMALARRMGFEYPSWAVRRLLDPSFTPLAPPERPAILCRHLGRELLHLAFVFRGAKSHAFHNWPSRTKTLWEMLHVGRNHVWYNWRKDDKRVLWADTWHILRSQFLRLQKQLRRRSLEHRVLDRLKYPVVRYKQAKVRASAKVSELLANAQHILFLCDGNINRSALAERHLKQLLQSGLPVLSCRFHLSEQRAPDPLMCSLVKKHGILLETWSSRTISHDLIAEADLIFVMEVKHLMRLFSEFPEARGRAFLLSCVTEPNTIPLEIQDPSGGALEVYERCIREVMKATTAIAERLKASRVRIRSDAETSLWQHDGRQRPK